MFLHGALSWAQCRLLKKLKFKAYAVKCFAIGKCIWNDNNHVNADVALYCGRCLRLHSKYFCLLPLTLPKTCLNNSAGFLFWCLLSSYAKTRYTAHTGKHTHCTPLMGLASSEKCIWGWVPRERTFLVSFQLRLMRKGCPRGMPYHHWLWLLMTSLIRGHRKEHMLLKGTDWN